MAYLAKFYGPIGYAFEPVETEPGVWSDSIVEKNYRGDVILNQVRMQSGDRISDAVVIDNSISIIANAYAYDNIGFMKYIVWKNVAWKIQSFSINRPRILLQIGEVYNGKRPSNSP